MIRMVHRVSKSIVSVALLILSGCAGPVALQPLPDHHPASPYALEAPVDDPQRILADQHQHDTTPMPAEEHMHEAPSELNGQVIYACPMHEEVKSTDPGKCPKCGMALVKREAQ